MHRRAAVFPHPERRHGGRPPALPPVPGDRPDGDGEPGDDDDDADRESVLIGRVLPGPPVDPPDEPRPFRPRGSQPRPPVIPPWLASRAALVPSLRWAAKEARYYAGFHAVPTPKYAAKTMVYALPGAGRIVARLVRWASAEEGNWHLRQLAADRGDAAQWLALDARRQRQASWRWPVLMGGAAVLPCADEREVSTVPATQPNQAPLSGIGLAQPRRSTCSVRLHRLACRSPPACIWRRCAPLTTFHGEHAE